MSLKGRRKARKSDFGAEQAISRDKLNHLLTIFGLP
jgi:hypothetical protein